MNTGLSYAVAKRKCAKCKVPLRPVRKSIMIEGQTGPKKPTVFFCGECRQTKGGESE